MTSVASSNHVIDRALSIVTSLTLICSETEALWWQWFTHWAASVCMCECVKSQWSTWSVCHTSRQQRDSHLNDVLWRDIQRVKEPVNLMCVWGQQEASTMDQRNITVLDTHTSTHTHTSNAACTEQLRHYCKTLTLRVHLIFAISRVPGSIKLRN